MEPPAEYVDGGYRSSLLNTGAGTPPINEMKGGLRRGRRKVGGDVPPAATTTVQANIPHTVPSGEPTTKEANVPPLPAEPTTVEPTTEEANVPASPGPQKDLFIPDITEEEFSAVDGNKHMTYAEFIASLDNCGTLAGQLTATCATVKGILYDILLYRLNNIVSITSEGLVDALPAPLQSYSTSELKVFMSKLQELLGKHTNLISNYHTKVNDLLNTLIGLVKKISEIPGAERPIQSQAANTLAELTRLLGVLDIKLSSIPGPAVGPIAALNALTSLAKGKMDIPAITTPEIINILSDLDRLIDLLNKANISEPAAAASAINLITDIRNKVPSELSAADRAIANEIATQLGDLQGIVLSAQTTGNNAKIVNTLKTQHNILQGLRTTIQEKSSEVDVAGILKQLKNMLILLEHIKLPAEETVLEVARQANMQQAYAITNELEQTTSVPAASGRIHPTAGTGLFPNAVLVSQQQRAKSAAAGPVVTTETAAPAGPAITAVTAETAAPAGPAVTAVTAETAAPAPAPAAAPAPAVAPAPLPTLNIYELSKSMRDDIDKSLKDPNSSREKQLLYTKYHNIIEESLNIKRALKTTIEGLKLIDIPYTYTQGNNEFKATEIKAIPKEEREKRLKVIKVRLVQLGANELKYNSESDFGTISDLIEFIDKCYELNTMLYFVTKKPIINISTIESIRSRLASIDK